MTADGSNGSNNKWIGKRTLRPDGTGHLSAVARHLDLAHQLVVGERLGEEMHLRVGQAMLHQHLSGVRRHPEQSEGRPAVEDPLAQLHAVDIGHHHVEHDEVHVPVSQLQDAHRLLGAGRLEHAVALLRKHSIEQPPRDPLVINYQDGWTQRWKGSRHWLASGSGDSGSE